MIEPRLQEFKFWHSILLVGQSRNSRLHSQACYSKNMLLNIWSVFWQNNLDILALEDVCGVIFLTVKGTRVVLSDNCVAGFFTLIKWKTFWSEVSHSPLAKCHTEWSRGDAFTALFTGYIACSDGQKKKRLVEDRLFSGDVSNSNIRPIKSAVWFICTAVTIFC